MDGLIAKTVNLLSKEIFNDIPLYDLNISIVC